MRLQHPDGWSVDRIPAWIKYATVEPGKMGAHYDGIHWSPPEEEQHKWCASGLGCGWQDVCMSSQALSDPRMIRGWMGEVALAWGRHACRQLWDACRLLARSAEACCWH